MGNRRFLFWAAPALLFFSCQTTPAPDPEVPGSTEGDPLKTLEPGQVLLQFTGPGLSPNGDGLFDTLELRPYIIPGPVVTKTRTTILNAEDRVVRAWESQGRPPVTRLWDGKDTAGRVVPDGRYKARLTVWWGPQEKILEASTEPFLLDTTGPAGTVKATPEIFSPDGDSRSETIQFQVELKDALTQVESWSLEVFNPADTPIKRFFGLQHPSGVIDWDGKGDQGRTLDSATVYELRLSARDSLGNLSRNLGQFKTDILMVKDGDKLKININSVTFKAYTADFLDVTPEERLRNLEVLDLLSAKLKTFPQEKIRLEGHAVMVFYDQESLAAKEQEQILLPLSEARAKAIKDALVRLGIEESRMTTRGYGGSRPIVPFSDLENRWKNRRVEFILER